VREKYCGWRLISQANRASLHGEEQFDIFLRKHAH
jgi:hypothetical protein